MTTIARQLSSLHFKTFDNAIHRLITISLIGELGNPVESYVLSTRFRFTPTMLATRSVINGPSVPDRTRTYEGAEILTNRLHSRQYENIQKTWISWGKLDGIFRWIRGVYKTGIWREVSLRDSEHAIITEYFGVSFRRVCKRAKNTTSLVIFALLSVGLSLSLPAWDSARTPRVGIFVNIKFLIFTQIRWHIKILVKTEQ